ncbi:helix-turn-helix transcriptional regulator [Sulfitobacter pontiacus]|uniref:helix-turn-helix transcriptional regulator n=1 Tax=Sulfitobacter pontiacus TaxID=60137 RepID=UPI0036DDD6CF
MYNTATAHDVLLPIGKVCEILSRSKASIYRDIDRGAFPKAQKLGRSSRWRLSIVMQVVEGTYPPESPDELTSVEGSSTSDSKDTSEAAVAEEGVSPTKEP